MTKKFLNAWNIIGVAIIAAKETRATTAEKGNLKCSSKLCRMTSSKH